MVSDDRWSWVVVTDASWTVLVLRPFDVVRSEILAPRGPRTWDGIVAD